jgi:sulfur-carrier protein
MAKVSFTEHVAKIASGAGGVYEGETLRDALAQVWRAHPGLKSYILDDQGQVRKHVAIFIDGELAPRASALDRSMSASSDVYVMQALSGG